MKSEERLGRMTKYLIKAPSWILSASGVILVSMLGGLGIFNQGFTKDLVSGFLIFGLPALISSPLICFLIKILSGSIKLERSFLLFFISSSFLVSMTSLGHLLSKLLPISEWNFYVLAIGIISGFSLMAIFTTAFPERLLHSALLSAIYPSISALSLHFLGLSEILPLSLAITAVSITLSALLIKYLDSPLRTFGISGFEFVYHFLEHGESGSNGMEEILKRIGEDVTVPVTVLSFWNSDEIIGALVIPSVHPGPFGEIGGGNLPKIISSSFPFPVLVAHGTCNHDFNPVSRDEIGKIISAVDRAIKNSERFSLASQPVRIQEGSVKMLAQRFGDSILMTVTTSPETMEDIDLGAGLAICYAAKSKGYRDASLIDAHNCGEPYSEDIMPGDRRVFQMMRAAERAGEMLRDAEMHEFRAGFAFHPKIGERDEGFGDDGIKALVIETGGVRTAYVVIDGNNMVRGLREKIIERLPVDYAEVMTTDNHVVNLRGGEIFVGSKGDASKIIEACVRTVENAISNMREAEVSMRTELVEGIRVFGPGKSSVLSAIGSATISAGKGLAIYALISAISLSLLAFLLL